MRATAALPLLLALVACSDDPAKQPAPSQAATGAGPVPFEHDFGVVPHGERRTQEFVVDLQKLGEPYIPMRVHLDCSCGHADLRLRKRDGSEREVIPSGMPSNLPAEGEQLVMIVTLDTARREAIDLPHTATRGYLLLQHLRDEAGLSRIQWPVLLRFGVDAPVELRPFASLDFGKVPASRNPEALTTVRGDAQHPQLRCRDVRCDDAAITATLEPRDDHTVLRVRCRPGEPGNHRAVLTVATEPSGYSFEVPVTWKTVPDLEASPMPKVSFRTPLDRAQTTAEADGQFVLVSDHDLARSPEFVVRKIVADDGRDLAACFATTLTPMPNDARQHRLTVRYLGGLSAAMRGTLLLGKPSDEATSLPIELVVFPRKEP